jgi:hypothetical protein
MALDGTYGGLKASVADFATRSDLTSQIPDFIAWAHAEICRRLRINTMLKTTAITVGTETLAKPADFLAINNIYLDLTPRQFLTVMDVTSIHERIASMGTQDYADSVGIDGSNFRFAPAFSTSAAGFLTYYATPSAFTNDASTNTILTKYPYTYLFGALEALFLFLEDDNNADRYGQRFGALLDSLNMKSADDDMSGPLGIGVYPGSVV